MTFLQASRRPGRRAPARAVARGLAAPARSEWLRRPYVAGVLVALVGQMLLPIAHATELARSPRGDPPAASAAAAAPGAPILAGASGLPVRHDPSRCAACRSLVHSGQALAPQARLLLAASGRSPSPAAPLRTPALVPERAHPPRAPPADSAPHPGA